MTVNRFQKDRSTQTMLCLLMMFFLFARICPSCHIVQTVPMQRLYRDKNASIQNAQALLNTMTVMSDKSIIEDAEGASIPAIKFAGIPFVFFFLIAWLPVSRIELLSFQSFSLLPDPDSNASRVLRL
ncbi:MAG: hypothetical protein JST19_03195 [Bacteroidetes bacterium]|nr:hypothetical protein [Bacteroidota bacterium]